MSRQSERREPPRPAVTPMFACACLLWGGCAASYYLGRMLHSEACMTATVASLFSGLVLASAILVFRKPTVAAGAMALFLGVALGFASACANHESSRAIENGSLLHLEATFEGDSRASSFGESAFCKVRLPSGTAVTAYASLDKAHPILHGTHAIVTGYWESPD